MTSRPEMLNRVTPWSGALALEFLTISSDCAVMRLPWRDDLAAFEDAMLLASGAIATLIDQACGMAVMARFDRQVVISTLNLKIDHVRPAATASSVTVEARCYHMTRNIAFVRADVWDTDPGALVAAAQGSFAFRRHPSP
ncbi:hypothetical protein ATE67_02495 [Sphingopyxis sp. H050]|jgi:uncharacterized protein (TIGR00369 family)|uniref:PaaI family thioesterase n=1 Tax=Sphingopyxis sp. H050 TaxID=1759072 RepID=UPI0007367E26|nr:PaaI family thioesterase [Sphingopyxis sp. H050]KTE22807.1 hypothetical protein ATE67_02495 [Sphingopyxis sp. H050]